jgi:hypothetical protein
VFFHFIFHGIAGATAYSADVDICFYFGTRISMILIVGLLKANDLYVGFISKKG